MTDSFDFFLSFIFREISFILYKILSIIYIWFFCVVHFETDFFYKIKVDLMLPVTLQSLFGVQC